MSRQEELRILSDDEINKMVHEIRFPKCETEYDNFFNGLGYDSFCSHPNSIMPIAFDNKIRLDCANRFSSELMHWEAVGYVQRASCNSYKFKSTNKNPLRAICEVYILMMEAKS